MLSWADRCRRFLISLSGSPIIKNKIGVTGFSLFSDLSVCIVFFPFPGGDGVVKEYKDESGLGNNKKPTITRIRGCPVHPGGHECGYYVMRYMRDIVLDDTFGFPKWPMTSRTRMEYTKDEIDEVQIEVVDFITSMIT